MTRIRSYSRQAPWLLVALLLGGCQTGPSREQAASDGSAPPAGTAARAILEAAQQARLAGDAGAALGHYQGLVAAQDPGVAAAALMGRFLLRIDPQGSERDPDQARALAAELAGLAERSGDPLVAVFSAAAAMRVDLQASINTLVKQSNDAERETQAVQARLDAVESELQQRNEAISRLRKALAN